MPDPAQKFLDVPIKGHDQRDALIRELEAKHGPVRGRWSRVIAIDEVGLNFDDGATIVIERQAHPRASWGVSKRDELPAD
jgi:hypothetical protein